MNRKEIIAAIKAAYPGFSEPDYTKCHNPQYYGIQLTAAAKRIEQDCLTGIKRIRKAPARNQLTWRADRSLFNRVQRAKEKTGISTTQEIITVAVMRYLEEVGA